ncbi:restriction endonuclease subunit S domain-containing protein [Falsiroseomonas stagni]|uniref:Type I restriction enzyme, S subunit n=1 Tax=Falsiroseomonas stagni DSM 19981 TaxID=1123062 RepID=A0A1I4F401_9PROT|nr:restriction endonuclease subunit S [Falsiroseomonas stagni]SFL12173.1 type I restriction enzyme, S subunit [Falsiroseomonas stagni DSM 19981]
MTFPAYPAYRESGNPWIGSLPVGWEVIALKRDLHFLTSGSRGWADHYADEGALFLRIGNLPRDGLELDLADIQRVAVPAGAEGERTRVEPGDVLFSITAFMGSVAVVPDKLECAYVSQHVALARLRGDLLLPRWVGYATLSAAGKAYLDAQCYGGTKIQLSLDDVANLPVTVPSVAEQLALIAFLDRETGKIDALVAEQERLIALLKEKRQAVISQAVTKGLNASAPMKDSGVAWLGQVPAHWEVLRLGALFREAIEEGEHDLPVLSVSIHDGVSDRELADSEMDRKVTRSEDRTKYKKVAVGDLVYNMMRAWQGGFGTVAVAGMVSPAYVVARPRGDLRTAFVEFVLRTPQAIEEMRRYSKGVTDFRLRLYWDEFKQIVLAVPPPNEQASILAAIDSQAARFDTLTTEAHRAIALLRERRAALISAAVTGKIDVGGLCLSVDEAV